MSTVVLKAQFCFSTHTTYATPAGPYQAITGDLDGDGKKDIAIGTNGAAVSVFRNTSTPGSITMAARADFLVGLNAFFTTMGDIDGDGKLDLAVSNFPTTLSILRNTGSLGSISFASKVDFGTSNVPRGIVIVDIDGDGKKDVAVGTDNNVISVFRNTSTPGTISFAARVDFAVGTTPVGVASADIDGDGKADLASCNVNSNTISMLRNTSSPGTISFAAKVDYASSTQPFAIDLADIDADGKPDIATANRGAATFSAWRNLSSSGSLALDTRLDFSGGSNPSSISLSDFDNDGMLDVAVGNDNAATISLAKNTGTPGTISFGSLSAYGTGTYPTMTAADLDNDGKKDLISANNISANISILRNVGAPNVTISVSSSTLCVGGSVVLTASGASTYSWSTGATSGSISVSPSVTTNYTVVGTTSSPVCTNTDVTTINVGTNPTITTGPEYTVTVPMPNGGTNNSDWSPWVVPISDPLPAGAFITGVDMVHTGVDQGWGGSGCTASFWLAGSYIGGDVYLHGPQTFTNTMTQSFPNYVYGGVNNFEMYFCGWPGWQGFYSGGTMYIRYQMLNAAPQTVCQNSSITLNAFGASTYSWSGGLINGVPSLVTSSQVYTVTGTTAFGCTGTRTIQVNATPAPTISSISGGTFVCMFSALNLSMNVSGTATSYSWSTGATSTSISVSPLVNTTYTATATNTAGCSHTYSTLISVGSLPTISVNSGSVCSGNVFTMLPSGASTYTYSNGSSTVVPLSNTSYSVSGTDAQGCVSPVPAVASVTVNTTPTVAVNNGAICLGQTFTITPSGASSYTFLSGASLVSPTVNSTYSVIGSSSLGCLSGNVALSTVTVNALPSLTISTPTAATCNGGSVTLTASGANTYTWSGGISNAVAFVPASSQTYSVFGTNTITGCSNTVAPSVNVTVYPLPVISVPNYTVCSGNSITLIPSGASTYTYSGGSALVSPSVTTSYSITGTSTAGCVSAGPAVSNVTVYITPTVTSNSGTICAGQSYAIVPSGASTYTISGGTFTVNPLVTTSYTINAMSANGCPATAPAVSTVTVFALPSVSISASNNTLCLGGSSTLTASNALSYTWSPGGSSSNPLVVTPGSTTTYTLAGTSTAGCTSTNAPSQLITVYPLPTLTAGTSSPAICLGAISTLTAGGASTYTWNPGALNTATISVSPLSSTVYTVTGRSAFGCASQNTLTLAVTVNTLPALSISSNTPSICFGGTATLSASGANTYTWSPGAATGNSFVVSPASNTTYSLSGTNTLTGCQTMNGANLTLTVNPLPVVAISTSSAVICFGQSSSLNASNASTYTWQPGGNTGSVLTVTPASSTTYTLSGTSAAGCTNTNLATQAITVNPLPVITASITQTVICTGNTVAVNASGASTYTWTSGLTNGTAFSPTATSTYTVNGTNALTGCTSTNAPVVGLTVNPLPLVGVNSATTAVCNGFSTSLSGTGAVTYTWSGGISNAVAFTPTGTGSYTVTGTSALGCTNTAVQTITVYTLPSVSLTVSQSVICLGDPVTLSGSGADTYTWNPFVPNATAFNPSVSATYTLAGTNTLTGCTSTNAPTQFVLVNPLPLVTATVSNPVICFGFSTSLSGGGATTYTWTGGVNNGAAFNPSATAIYTVTGTDLNACVNTTTALVTVNPLPVLVVSSTNTMSCEADTQTLSVSGASSYTWNTSPAALSSSIVTSPTVSTNYTVNGIDANGCFNSTVFTQSVQVCQYQLALNPQTNSASCQGRPDGYLNLNPQIDVSKYTSYKIEYFWTSSTGSAVCPSNNCTVVDSLKAGFYTVKVKVTYTLNNILAKADSNIVSNVEIKDGEKICELIIYNGLTLNNDGLNEIWHIENIDLYPNNKVTVFTRWGKEVGHVTAYDNIRQYWPRNEELDKLESATYYYVIDLGDGSALRKGFIEIVKN
ncbi:MAG TPA: FG-GAP-like repeat-containing protein [Bacteroidia bacterium]|nr:FG-GAP-like repeat-containing protein [Bacteroidia bacterium]